jgi:hypothetical protein
VHDDFSIGVSLLVPQGYGQTHKKAERNFKTFIKSAGRRPLAALEKEIQERRGDGNADEEHDRYGRQEKGHGDDCREKEEDQEESKEAEPHAVPRAERRGLTAPATEFIARREKDELMAQVHEREKACVANRRDDPVRMLHYPFGEQRHERQKKEEEHVSPYHCPGDFLDAAEKERVAVPVRADDEEADEKNEYGTQESLHGGQIGRFRQRYREHHNGHDDGDHAVAEILDPLFTHFHFVAPPILLKL